jgi:hypothetical protein
MNRTARFSITALAVLVLAPASVVAQQALPMRDGLWAISVQVSIPGMAFEMPAITTEQCLTPEQVEDPAGFLARDPVNDPAESQCQLDDYTVAGPRVSWTISCAEPPLQGTGEITLTSDTAYTGSVTLTTEQGPMTMLYDGERVGECAAPAP